MFGTRISYFPPTAFAREDSMSRILTGSELDTVVGGRPAQAKPANESGGFAKFFFSFMFGSGIFAGGEYSSGASDQ